MNSQEYDQIIKMAADLERGAEAECKKEIEKRQKYMEGYMKGMLNVTEQERLQSNSAITCRRL